MKKRSLLLLTLLMCSGFARADIYRFVDDAGRTVFTDMPPSGRPYEVMAKNPVPPAAVQNILREEPVAAPRSAAPARLPMGEAAAFKRARYALHIEQAARANNLDPALLHAVILAESGYDPGAMSPKGAVGLMQLMPETARRYSVRNRWDPMQNIHGGARYLRDLLQMFNNDLRLAVAAYNAGENAVSKHGNRIPPYAETMAYVPRVLGYYKKYRGIH